MVTSDLTFVRDADFNCNGCGACTNVCPPSCLTLKPDSEGFFYPVITDDTCTHCNLCNTICPELNLPDREQLLSEPIVIAAYSNDREIREKSSSGGVFAMLALQVIQNHGRVYGAVFDRTQNLVHVGANTLDGFQNMRGSKYVQSDIGWVFREIREDLRNQKQVLFSGVPCQVAGLKAFLHRRYENLTTCDVVCHGVPSPKVFKSYTDFLEKEYGSMLTRYSFRSKRTGWNQYSVVATFANGKEYVRSFKRDMFMRAFLRNYPLIQTCYACKFLGFPRWGDITLADYWGVEKAHPDLNDDRGISLLFLNTQKGIQAFETIKQQVTYRVSDRERATALNTSIVQPVAMPVKRAKFFKDLETLPFNWLSIKYGFYPFPKFVDAVFVTKSRVWSWVRRLFKMK